MDNHTPEAIEWKLAATSQACGRLNAILNDTLSKGFRAPEDDYLARILFIFLAKQQEHLRSLAFLLDGEAFQDMGLVARAMLEDAATVNWILSDTPKRAKDWCAFSMIHDFKLIERRIEQGKSYCARDRREIIQRVRTEGQTFRKKNREKFPNIDDPNSYHDYWPSVQISARISEYDEGLRPMYDTLSSWAHGAIASLGQALRRNGDKITLDFVSKERACAALILGFQSSAFVIDRWATHRNSPRAAEVNSLVRQHIRVLDAPSIRPIRDRVLLKPLEPEATIIGTRRDQGQAQINQAIVVAFGTTRPSKRCVDLWAPLSIGACVLFHPDNVERVIIADEPYLLCEFDRLLAVIE